MINLLDLPPNCVESMATQFASRYFSSADLSYVLSTFNNANYCKYILSGKFCSKECEYFDNIYINIYSKEIPSETRKHFRIVDLELVLSSLSTYLELQNLCLAPLIRVWSGDQDLTIILALSPYVIRHQVNGKVLMFKDDNSVRNLEMRTEITRKIWGSQQLLLADYQYFKQAEIDNIDDLTIELDDQMNITMEGLRYLHPTKLSIVIKSKKLSYSGEVISQVLDLTKVRDFTLTYPIANSTVTHWKNIVHDLEVVQKLDISIGTIKNLSDFFDYNPWSIDKFKITLFGENINLDNIHLRLSKVMRTDDYDIVFKHESELCN